MCEIVASIPLAVNENLNIQKRRIQNSKSKTRLSLVTGTHGDELEGQYLAYMVGSYTRNYSNLTLIFTHKSNFSSLNSLAIREYYRGRSPR